MQSKVGKIQDLRANQKLPAAKNAILANHFADLESIILLKYLDTSKKEAKRSKTMYSMRLFAAPPHSARSMVGVGLGI